MEKQNKAATRRAAKSKSGDTLSTREKRGRKRYLCDYIQKHRELTPADKAVGRLLVNWYNEKAGNCYASIERLANELELSRKTVKRAVGKLHRLGIVRRDIGGGWDHGKLRWNTSKYYPAFPLVTHSETGRPRKNLPPSLSTSPPEAKASKGRGGHSDPGSNCPPMSPPESQAERGEGGSNCPPNSDSDSSGRANAARLSADAPTLSADALQEIEDEDEDEDEILEREYSIITLASELVAASGLDLDRLALEGLSDNTLCGLDIYSREKAEKSDFNPSNVGTLAGNECDLLLSRGRREVRIIQGLPVGDWRTELQTLETLSEKSRVKVAWWY